MGWSSGTRLFVSIMDSIKDRVDVDTREEIYYDIIEAFEDFDCDELQECMGDDPAFDKVFKEIHPEYFEEEENYSDDD